MMPSACAHWSIQSPVFEIQLVVSPALIRETLVPQIQAMSALSALALLGSVLIAFVAANLALRPVERINQALDAIASGVQPAAGSVTDTAQGEFAAVQTKLNGVVLVIEFLASCQLFGNTHGSFDPCCFSCSKAPPIVV